MWSMLFWGSLLYGYTAIILVMGSANERRRYIVTPPRIASAHNQNDPWVRAKNYAHCLCLVVFLFCGLAASVSPITKKTLPYWYRNSHYKPETVVRP